MPRYPQLKSVRRQVDSLTTEFVCPTLTIQKTIPVNILLQQTILLAETRVTDIQTRYQDQSASDDGSAMGLVLGAAAVIVVVGLVFRFVVCKPRVDNTPIGLMNELCVAHGVSNAGRRLMTEIALSAELPQPASIFLGQAHFESALESARPKMKWDENKKKALGILQRHLSES